VHFIEPADAILFCRLEAQAELDHDRMLTDAINAGL
jgi:hypothetical protein